MKARSGSKSTHSVNNKHVGEYVNHVINPLQFSSKSSGTNNRNRQRGQQDPPQPIQIINPVGNFGIALPMFTKRSTEEDADRGFNASTVVISGPEDEEMDQKKLLQLVTFIVILFFLNITSTCLLFFYPNSVDISKVLPPTALNSNQLAFVEIPEERSGAEKVLFYFTLVNLCLGVFSALFKQPLGLACYVLIVILIFFLGFTSIPYFIYTMRYTLDALCGYVAMVLISRLTVNFLKIHG